MESIFSKLKVKVTVFTVVIALFATSINVFAAEVVNDRGRVMQNVNEAISLSIVPYEPGKDGLQIIIDRSKLPQQIRDEQVYFGIPGYFGGIKYDLYDPYAFIGGGYQPGIMGTVGLPDRKGYWFALVVLYDAKKQPIAYAEIEIDTNSNTTKVGSVISSVGGGSSSGSTSSATPAPSATPKPSAGPATVKSIAVSVSKIQLNLEETKAIKVQAILSDNTRKDVTDDCDYFSNDTQVADIDSGNVTGIAKGETSIVVNYKGLEKTVPVEVNDPENLDLTKLEASEKSVKLKAGQQMELFITGVYEDGSREDVTGEVLWQSSKGSVATVADGIISAKAIGAATITASLDGKTVQVKLIVEKAKKLKSLTASSNSLTIKEEGTATIKVTATYVDNTKEDVTTKVIWTIANTDIVDVRSGKFYAQDLGKTVVKGKFDTKLVTVNVNVR
jgi:hypothetical protein